MRVDGRRHMRWLDRLGPDDLRTAAAVRPALRRRCGTLAPEQGDATLRGVDLTRQNACMQSLRAWVKNRRAMRRRPSGTELRPIRWLPTTAIVVVAVVGGGLVALWLLN